MVIEAGRESQFRILANRGSGLVDALNQGLAECQGDIFLRMDADDAMDPLRVGRQMEHLKDVDVSCCRVHPFGHVGEGRREYFNWQNGILSQDQLRSNRYVECPFQHPTLALSVRSLRKVEGYRHGDFPEDYDLFLRILENGLTIEKLSDTLLHYRCSENQLSHTDERYSKKAFHNLRRSWIRSDASLPERWKARPLVVWGASRTSRRRFEDHFPGLVPDYFVDIKPSLIDRDTGLQGRDPAAESRLPESDSGPLNSAPEDSRRRPGIFGPEYLFKDHRKPFVLVYVNARGARPIIESALGEKGFFPDQDYLCIG